MCVSAYATTTGWVMGTMNWFIKADIFSYGGWDADAYVTVKLVAHDKTDNAIIEKVLLHTHSFVLSDEWRLDTMDIPLFNGHAYEFYLNAEVHAHAVGLAAALADVAGFYRYPDCRIKWGYLDVPNTIEDTFSYGCPALFVWDGTSYASEGLLDIHNPEGIDIIRSHTLIATPQRVNNAYLFQLIEHPKTHSYIDQVKLYAKLKYGTMVELPLMRAWHSEYGDVLPQLLVSDDRKTDMRGAEHNNGTSQSMELEFAALPPNLNVIGFIFQIEGNNRDTKE
jgi:hypothetical protein